MSKKFIRTKEDLTCEVCGEKTKGNGYTDHCPHCLWSKHVDIYPGDRQSECGGLMKPLGAHQDHGEWKIKYKCQRCGYERQNKMAKDDDFDKVATLSVQHQYTHQLYESR